MASDEVDQALVDQAALSGQLTADLKTFTNQLINQEINQALINQVARSILHLIFRPQSISCFMINQPIWILRPQSIN